LRIKICGITSVEDGRAAAFAGADAIGLNFYSRSPRFIEFSTAKAIVNALPPFVEAVGLFVNETLADACRSLEAIGGVRTIQWHGDQLTPTDVWPYRVIPAFAVLDANSLQQINAFLDVCRDMHNLPAAIMVDAHMAGHYGGTGQKAPWDLLADFRPGVPVVLAGGLTPDNVAEAIRTVRPYAVDVASGVEISPGRKDHSKMQQFVSAARVASAGIC
jgi:phosphoribosylanthranilate isomerase